jgi:tRNA pseudouridine-54 N-methylase
MKYDTWIDCERKKGVKVKMNILHKITNRKANWIAHILRRNYLVKRVIEGEVEVRIEVKGRRGKISK